MSRFKNWKITSPIELPDVERWDLMTTPNDIRAYVISWLNGEGLSGMNNKDSIKSLNDTGAYLALPVEYTNPSNTTPITVTNNYYCKSLDRGENIVLDENDIALMSNDSTTPKSLLKFQLKEDDNKLNTFSLGLLYDVKKYVMDTYAELMPSSNPSWSVILTTMKKLDINIIIYCGGLHIRNLEDSSNTGGLQVQANGHGLGSSGKTQPLRNVTVDADLLRKLCNNDGVLYLGFSGWYNTYWRPADKEKVFKQGELVSTGMFGLGGTATYSFNDTYLLRNEFNQFITGTPLTLTTETNASLITVEQTTSHEGYNVEFNGSPIRNFITGTYYEKPDKATRIDKATMKKYYEGSTSQWDNFMANWRTTDEMRLPNESSRSQIDGAGRIPCDNFDFTNNKIDSIASSFYSYETELEYSYHAGGYLITNFVNGIQYQGWEFDWIQFFDKYYPNIFNSGISREDKLNIIKTQIKPTLNVKYKDVRGYNVYSDETSKEDKSFLPTKFMMCCVANRGNNFYRVGARQEVPFEYDYDNPSNVNTGWLASQTVFNNITLGVANIDDKGYTYVAQANMGFNQHKAYSGYTMQEKNSPINYTVSFKWGLREFITNLK